MNVYLDTNNNGAWNTGEPSSITIADGTFVFSNLISGSYKVRQVTPAGYVRTAPETVDSYSIVLTAGQNANGSNFSNAALWDLNGNGLMNSAETILRNQANILFNTINNT